MDRIGLIDRGFGIYDRSLRSGIIDIPVGRLKFKAVLCLIEHQPSLAELAVLIGLKLITMSVKDFYQFLTGYFYAGSVLPFLPA